MPIKYNLTKFDKFAERIQAVATKNPGDPDDLGDSEEALVEAQAIILTSMCSAFSYQTSKTMANGAMELNSEPCRMEYILAKRSWKHLRNVNIQEVAAMNIRDSRFYLWLHYNVNRDQQELYKKAWGRLKVLFGEACDEIGIESQRV